MNGLSTGPEKTLYRLFLLSGFAMLAFAANSLLNRAALVETGNGPAAFGAIRLLSGAICLSVLCRLGGRPIALFAARRWLGAGSLALYIFGFSFAYLALDAGLGALVLFGVVQMTMFAGALTAGERPPAPRWIGTGIAVAGLFWLVGSGPLEATSGIALALMALAGLGWGIYSLAGRQAIDPLSETAANFIVAAPIGVLIWALAAEPITLRGIGLAVASGALASGLGYALWYSILPRISASSAALAQLTVPAIAAFGGVILLGEALTWRLILASAVILGGVALGTLAQRTRTSKGS